uniref:Centromere protein Cenp-F N-terminal domain-containing protein n=1 Tax=Fundulus heteroclitus TaxID=8078 RepID=A0A3Q2PLI1_FUNHE
MSWAEEDWTVGLSGRVLQKVKELQVLKERLSRENKQKQLQLDNTQTSLEKQTAKVNTAVLIYSLRLLLPGPVSM